MWTATIRTTLGPLRDLPDFRSLWLAGTVSSLGSAVFEFAILWYVTVELQSALATTLVVLATTLPYLVLGLPAGAIVDRLDQRQLMIAMDVVRALVVVAIPVVDLVGTLSLPLILLLASVRSAAEVVFSPAEQAMLVRLVPEDRLPTVNSFNITSQRLVGTVAPTLAGVLIAVAGTTTAFYVDAVSFLLSALVITRIARLPRFPSATTGKAFSWRGFASEVAEGGRSIWTTVPLRILSLVTLINIFGFAAFRPVGLLYFQEQLGMGAQTYGVITSISLVGLTIGSAIGGKAILRLGAFRLFGLAHLLLGVMTLLIALTSLSAIIALANACRSVGIGLVNVAYITVLQRYTPSALRGRVFATADTLSEGGRPVALAGGAGLADLASPRIALMATSGAFLIAALVARGGQRFDRSTTDDPPPRPVNPAPADASQA